MGLQGICASCVIKQRLTFIQQVFINTISIIIIIIKLKQWFMYRYTTNVEPEMYDYTSNNWSHWDSNEELKEKFGSYTRKIFDRFTTKDSYTWNITHDTESTAM